MLAEGSSDSDAASGSPPSNARPMDGTTSSQWDAPASHDVHASFMVGSVQVPWSSPALEQVGPPPVEPVRP
jgi:hypothetical protein